MSNSTDIRNRRNSNIIKTRSSGEGIDGAQMLENQPTAEQQRQRMLKRRLRQPNSFAMSRSEDDECALKVAICVLLVVFCLLIVLLTSFRTTQEESLIYYSFSDPQGKVKAKGLTVTSWNVGKEDRYLNPFQLWVGFSSDRAESKKHFHHLMERFEQLMLDPIGSRLDVRIDNIFTKSMFDELLLDLKKVDVYRGSKLRKRWEKNYRKKLIISEFLKNQQVTNKTHLGAMLTFSRTLKVISGISNEFVYVQRPTLTSCYTMSLPTFEDFWEHWRTYMFRLLINRETGPRVVAKCIENKGKTKRSLEVAEMILVFAIYDSILVYLANSFFSEDIFIWQDLRHELCDAFLWKRSYQALTILKEEYDGSDVIFLQNAYGELLNPRLNKVYAVLHSQPQHEQSSASAILLRRSTFPFADREFLDITSQLWNKTLGVTVPSNLYVLQSNSFKQVLMSYSADGDSQATIKIVEAVVAFVEKLNANLPEKKGEEKYKLLIGMSANTRTIVSKPSELGFLSFVEFCRQQNLKSCWDRQIRSHKPDRPSAYPNKHAWTSSRKHTFLQIDQTKAVRHTELESKGAGNPSDFILFSESSFSSKRTMRDNTGKKVYSEKVLYPSLDFPFSHVIISAEVDLK